MPFLNGEYQAETPWLVRLLLNITVTKINKREELNQSMGFPGQISAELEWGGQILASWYEGVKLFGKFVQKWPPHLWSIKIDQT